MKASRIVIAVLVLFAVGAVAYTMKGWQKTFGNEAQKEAEAQAQEILECKNRLTAFHKAWSDYRSEHKGNEPGIVDLAKYIKDPEKWMCPTAARWKAQGKYVEAGNFDVKDRKYIHTYRFMWATPQAPALFKKLGDKAVLVRCSSHAEALYRAGYKRGMKNDPFGEENRAKLISEVANAKDYVVLRNGTIEERDPGSQ